MNNKKFPFGALGILLGIVLVSIVLVVSLSPTTTTFPDVIPSDLMGNSWIGLYGGGSIPQTDGQFQVETFTIGWIPDWERVEIVDTANKVVIWNWNIGSVTTYSYTLRQDSCQKLGDMSLYLTFKHEEGSEWDSYKVEECRDPNPKEEPAVDVEPVLVTISIKGQACPEGEVVGYTYGYQPADATQPMTYSLLGETVTHEIDLSTQETMINFQGYNEAGEPIGSYSNETRVLHNASCAP